MRPNLAIRYFQCWANKDIASLELLIAEDAILLDWEGPILGRDKILDGTKLLFSHHKKIGIEIKKIAVGQDTIIAELEIRLDNMYMRVVDVIDYDENDKIKRIRAYRQ